MHICLLIPFPFSWAKSAVCMLTHWRGPMQSVWFKGTLHECSGWWVGNILNQAFYWRNCVENAFSFWPHLIYFLELEFGEGRELEKITKKKNKTWYCKSNFLELVLDLHVNNWMILKTQCPICSVLQGYGKADHSVTVEILKKEYTDYEITWSDDKK